MEEGNKKTPIWAWFFVALFSPIILFVLLCMILYTPIGYIRFKTSLYHKDFGGKYSFFGLGFHYDNKYYTVIKKNDLPIEYLKHDETYASLGHFVYRDSLLIFDFPFWYDEDRGEWVSEDYENEDDEATLNLEETKQEYLKSFHEKFSERKCERVIFFIEKKSFQKRSGEVSLRSAEETDCFVVYEGKLVDALKKFVDQV